MTTAGHLLVLDDDEDILLSARLLFKRQIKTLSCLSNPDELPEFLARNSVDVVLLDMNFTLGDNSGRDGFKWLAYLQAQHPQLVVVVMTAYAGVELAVSAIKAGATDFVIKPWSNEKLIATINGAFELARARKNNQLLQNENAALRSSVQHLSLSQKPTCFIGETSSMRELLRKLNLCAPTEANVLILGENGSGKELLAREVHARSKRADNVFMAIDMGAIPESLFEAELFGYKKGAFTGANENRMGKLVAANGGTLFLDEIANLALHLQVKLLRVLEQRQVTPVGDEKPIVLDVRVIAATNASYAHLTDERQFRQDLLYRLNTVELTLPPLRERKDDISLLADHFLTIYAQKYQRKKPLLSHKALAALREYAWPGNVRALNHAIERALVLSDKDTLQAEDFALAAVISNAQDALTDSAQNNSLNLELLERNAVEQALKKHAGNISQAARDLGLTRMALYRRMEKYDL
ncbi:MAG TPA: sigma-54 dependent transcriptional regulator [Cellvibrio sp.]|nr:sigma-54 dependent transcriptional regulator [Cellvibrio sp.]